MFSPLYFDFILYKIENYRIHNDEEQTLQISRNEYAKFTSNSSENTGKSEIIKQRMVSAKNKNKELKQREDEFNKGLSNLMNMMKQQLTKRVGKARFARYSCRCMFT